MNPLKELYSHGQSPWMDYIRRDMILSGALKKQIEEDGLRGITSNPTIFEKALSAGTDYDLDIQGLLLQGKSTSEIFEALSVEDIQMAADLFRQIYDETEGEDGTVSLEVSPHLARDTERTIAEARHLWARVARPNVMIKIPGTREGLPAIEQCLAEGIPINVTLIFSLERYGEVLGVFRKALERRSEEGKSVVLSSVASFFVSRIDTAIDKILQEKIHASSNPREKDLLLEILGRVAVANSRVAYQLFKKTFSGAWFQDLKKKGARPQRLLWASTGTKNPHYSDVLYVEELIGPQTVNTLPLTTLDAFRDHGKPLARLEEDVPSSVEVLKKLRLASIDFSKITDQLEREGLQLFTDSYDKLLAGLEAKKEFLEASLCKH
jgi:transaldolase/glucose-6-phosphate isomerase